MHFVALLACFAVFLHTQPLSVFLCKNLACVCVCVCWQLNVSLLRTETYWATEEQNKFLHNVGFHSGPPTSGLTLSLPDENSVPLHLSVWRHEEEERFCSDPVKVSILPSQVFSVCTFHIRVHSCMHPFYQVP